MRNVLIWSVVVFAMAGTACNRGYKPPKPSWPTGVPKELAVDLGNGVRLEMALIPAGEFMMGSPDADGNAANSEKPPHRVRITKPFYLGKYLVTQEQWETVMGGNPSGFQGPKNPVETVSWDDCQTILGQAQGEVGPWGRDVPVAQRGPVGICLPGRNHDSLLLRGRGTGAGRIWLVSHELG